MEAVLALSNRLRTDGIETHLDQYVGAPPEGWPTWMAQQLEAADLVLAVCTAEYRRRFDPEHDRGKGARYETTLITQALHDDRMVNRRIVPVLFEGASEADILPILKPYSYFVVTTEAEYQRLLRHLWESPEVVAPRVRERPELPPKASPVLRFEPSGPSEPAPSAAAPEPRVFAVDPRVGKTFVGREAELAKLRKHLLTPDSRDPVAICAVDGMGGVGKSYLADRFAWEHREDFPGGYVRLVLDPRSPQEPDAALAELAEQLGLAEGAGVQAQVRQALQSPRTLLHVENVDSDEAYRSTASLLSGLDGCTVVVSGRLARLGASQGWARVDLGPFSKETALDQLWQELERQDYGKSAKTEHNRLVDALGRLPLAIHLAAGHLALGRTVDSFLRRLRSSGLALEPADGAETVGKDQGRRILSEVFGLSIELLEESLGERSAVLLPGLEVLGHAPASGFGRSLGAALAGLGEDDFEDLVLAAVKLSLLLHIPASERPEGAWKMHPLVAELTQQRRVSEPEVVARVTEWFVERLPKRPPGEEHAQGIAWRAIHQEHRALAWWLERVPEASRHRVERAGSQMSATSGPYRPWISFCQASLEGNLESDCRSNFLWTLSQSALCAGEIDQAQKAAEEKTLLDRERGDKKGIALARGVIADILYSRGDLDEALRIRQEEQLPVYEQLGDVRERAVTMGKIANILYRRGDLDEALRIREEEQLPVFERLGDVRERAVTQGQIADIVDRRGDLDEALRIRQEDELPAYEQLGDVRSRAVTMGKIACFLAVRGDFDEALRILKEEKLPIIEQLGDVRSSALAKGQVADILEQRGDLDQALRIREEEELPVFEQLGDVRELAKSQGKIAGILSTRGAFDEALHLLQEEVLPVFEQLGDVRSRLVTWARLGQAYLARGGAEDRLAAATLFRQALQDAERLQIPEAATIRDLLKPLEDDEA